jgi:hypothetical protein
MLDEGVSWMDDIVKQAMAKWPNVPHCYGWLALDARGTWRMRDERTQTLRLPGDKIANPALVRFINRNYMHDDQGRWYFQNGPQRVYVNLEATPYVTHTDPAQGFVLHTGEPLSDIDGAWLTEAGQLLLKSAEKIALVDDRDMAQCIAGLRIDGAAVADEYLLDWLNEEGSAGSLTLLRNEKQIPVQRIALGAIAEHFGFVQAPQPDGV